MPPSPESLPHILQRLSVRKLPSSLDSMNVSELKHVGRPWLTREQLKLNRDALLKTLRNAFMSQEGANRVCQGLVPHERSVLEACCRYGGVVEGEVLLIDLKARGLFEVVEKKVSDRHIEVSWKHNPLNDITREGILLDDSPGEGYHDYPNSYYMFNPRSSIKRLCVQSSVADLLPGAGPPGWSIPYERDNPPAVARRSLGEVTLDLARVYAWLVSRGSVKVYRNGMVTAPTLKSLAKTVPLSADQVFVLPDVHGLYFALLRLSGAIRIDGEEAVPDPSGMSRLVRLPGPQLAHTLARGWLRAEGWYDALGVAGSSYHDWETQKIPVARQVLAWSLASLVHAGDHWYDLTTFLDGLAQLLRHRTHFPFERQRGWLPDFLKSEPKRQDTQEQSASVFWIRSVGAWYANALMVTLVHLGLVERAWLGTESQAPGPSRIPAHRLRPRRLRRPEIQPPADPAYAPCLLVQPNFDLIIYLDHASPQTAAFLGTFTESTRDSAGPVQTGRITQARFYQAQESGISLAEIVGFLKNQSQREIPANVLQSLVDWASRRESMTLESGVTMLGFPSSDERDAYLAEHPNVGRSCGERFLLARTQLDKKPVAHGALLYDHRDGPRLTLSLDEHGEIRSRSRLDIVQAARLRRIALPTAEGWRLSAETVQAADRQGSQARSDSAMARGLSDPPNPPLDEAGHRGLVEARGHASACACRRGTSPCP